MPPDAKEDVVEVVRIVNHVGRRPSVALIPRIEESKNCNLNVLHWFSTVLEQWFSHEFSAGKLAGS